MIPENKIVYRKKYKFLFKPIISQEIYAKEKKNKVYIVGKRFPINKKKIFESPEILINKRKDKTLFFRLSSFILIFLCPFAPYVFTKFSLYDLTSNDYSNIANTIYGLTGPFIAVAAAFLTYAAFIVQKKANDIQIESTNEQIKKNKIDSFENKLFKLIDSHRQNVNELKIKINNSTELVGQKAITYMRINIYIINFLLYNATDIKKIFKEKDIQILSYLIYVHGNSLIKNKYFKETEKFNKYAEQKEYINKVIELLGKMSTNSLKETDEKNAFQLQQKIQEYTDAGIQPIINNRMDVLSRYFRQIYQIYKYIDGQEFLSENEKYEYAKVFRTNLTNYEQELMFNNIISPYGKPWIINNFVIKYKPFKNLAAYSMYGYSPADYYKDTYNIQDSNLYNYLDVYSYNNGIEF